MGILSFISITKDQILQWINTGSLIAFIAVLVFVLIAFLGGLLRGWKSGTYHFIARALFFIIPLFFLGMAANALGGINLAQWIKDPIVIKVNSSTVQVEVTTVFETLYKLVYVVLHDVFKLSGSASSIANYSIALAGSLIRLVLVVVWAIVTWTFGSWLISLLWHLVFKRFIPKQKRKPKLRWVSAIEEAVAFMAIAIVGIAPLSGTLNAVKNNAKLPPSSNETISMVREVIDTYDKSIFNQAFFAWTKGSGTDTLDTQIAQFFADNSYAVDEQTYHANLVTEVRVFAGVEGAIVNTVVSEKPANALFSSVFHTALMTAQALYTIAEGDNALADSLVPLAYDIAENADFLKEEYDFAGISNDFTASKRARVDAFDRVAESSFVQTVESSSVQNCYLPVYDGLSSFSELTLDHIEEKMASDSDTRNYVNALISGYVYQDYSLNDDSIFQMLLPMNAKGELDEERFGQIDWFREAALLRECRDRVAALHGDDEATGSGSSQITSKEEQEIEEFLAKAAKNMGKIITILVGERDENGVPITNDKGQSKEGLCLLDSDLLATIMPAVLQASATYLKDSVLTDAEDPTDFLDKTGAIVEELVGDKKKPAEAKINFKQEFGSILDIVGDVAQSEAGQAFIADYKNHPGLEFAGDGTLIEFSPSIAEAFMAGIVNLDCSKVLSYATPVLGQHFVRPLLADDGALGKIGIKNLDFSCDSLGLHLADLLSVGKYCNGVLSAFGGLFKGENASNFSPDNFFAALTVYETEAQHYQVTRLLDIFSDSPILNPDYVIDGETYTNCNIANLLKNILGGLDKESELTWDQTTLSGMDLGGEWEGNVLKSKGDNYYTVQVFKQLAETGIIEEFASLSGASSTQAIQTLSTIGIDSLFENIGKSSVLRKILPTFFDSKLLGTLLNSDNSLDLKSMGITYENLLTAEDWTYEGLAMQAILDLAANGLDLADLDIFNPSIIELLGDLSESRIFVLPDDTYVFGTFFTDKMLVSLTEASQFKLFLDYGLKTVPEFDGKTVEAVVTEKGDLYWSNKSASVLAEKKALCTTFVRAMALPQDGDSWKVEFLHLRDAIACISGLGGIDALTEFNSDSVPSLTMALQSLVSMDSLGTVLPGNVFKKAFESGKVSDAISADHVNMGWFFRNAEDFVTAMEENGYDRTSKAVKPYIQARETEMNYMLSLVTLAASNESIKTGQMNFATLDVNGFLRPLFYAAGYSKVLNPTSTADLYSSEDTLPELSVFEDLIMTFVKNAGVYSYVDADGNPVSEYTKDNYDTAYIKGTKKTLKSIIKGLSSASGWVEETDALCDLVEILQGSSFLKDGKISFEVFSTQAGLQEFFAKEGSKEELADLMGALERSELFYRCLPGKLETAINDALKTVTFGYLAKDIACADFYLYTDTTKADFPRYTYEGSNNTVDGLVEVFAALSACTNIKMSDFTTVNVGALTTALSTMAVSPIFNSDTTKSVTEFASVATERKGMTAFQALFCDVLNVDALDDYMFYAASPKDSYYVGQSTYSDADTKTAYVIKSLFPVLDGTNTVAVAALADTYIVDELGSCLSAFKEDRFSGFISGSASFSDLDEDSFASLLNTMNDCTLLRDCVPNAAHKTLISDGTIDIDGIALTSADVFFSYYYHDGHGNFSSVRDGNADFSMPFYAPEIDQIAAIYALLNNDEIKTIMSNMNMKTLDPMLARNVLLDLHDSYIFHEAAKENRDVVTPPIVNSDDPTIIENFPSLTVFEQFVYKVMYKAGLLSMNYSAPKFYQFAYDGDGNYIGTAGAYYKGYADIVDITDSGDNWLAEINALTTDGLHHEGLSTSVKDPIVGIIASAQSVGMFDSGEGVTIDFDTLKRMSPENIRGLLYSINCSVLLDDSLPLSLTSFLGSNSSGSGIGLDNYTTNTYEYALTSGEKSFDMKNVTALFDDGDASKAFHSVSKITIPVSASIDDGFTAIYHKDATTDIDMTKMFASTYDSLTGLAVLSTSDRLWVPVEITITNSATFTGSPAQFVVDYADYDIGRSVYESNAIDAMGYLLASAYRGDAYSSRYFSFNDSGDGTLASFFQEKESGLSAYDHSTYGLLALFADSGFYEAQLDGSDNFVSSSPNHTAGAYALYNALRFKTSVAMELTIKTSIYGDIPLPTITELSLGELIGSGTTDAEHLSALNGYFSKMLLTDMDYVTKEAYWFDQFAAASGTFAAYETVLVTALELSPIDGLTYELLAGIDKQFSTYSDDPVGEIVKALGSSLFDYSIAIPLSDADAEVHSGTGKVPEIGSSVITNLVSLTGAHKATGLDLDFTVPEAINALGSKKNTRIDVAAAKTALTADYSSMNDAYFQEVIADFNLMKLFYNNATSAFSSAQKAAAQSAFAGLSDTGGAAAFNKIFYISSLYDQMIYHATERVNGVYHNTSASDCADLPSYLSAGNINGTPTALTFANVASLYA